MEQFGNRPLIFSMGFNGYQWIYRENVSTHKVYAERYGYDYVMVQHPSFTPLLMECAWLKLSLLVCALRTGRPWILFLDADVQISERAPAADTLFLDEKALYLAKGHSGRVNSGVIIAKNSEALIDLVNTMISSALLPIPKEDDVGWGENGHVIHYAKSSRLLEIVDTRWNNTSDINLDDYFRHFTGPLKPYYDSGKLGVWARRVTRAYMKSMRLAGFRDDPAHFYERLSNLTRAVQKRYPQFNDGITGRQDGKRDGG